MANRSDQQLFEDLSSEILDGESGQVAEALEQGFDPNFVDETGLTLLYLAASCGNVPAARILLDHDADPNLPRFSEGVTPLHATMDDARIKGNFTIAKLLVEHGADPRQDDAYGLSPLREAREVGPQELADWFEANT